MPKITATTLAATALLIVGLTGCSGATDPAPAEPVTSTETAAPLVAETPDAEPVADTPEGVFLAELRDVLKDDTQIPDATDEQLVAAGQDACQQLAEGKGVKDVRVIEGEQPNAAGWYADSGKIASVAERFLCA